MTHARAISDRTRWVCFLGIALSVTAIASAIARSHTGSALPLAASFDLALTVPAAWYWIMVRSGRRSKVTLILVALAGLMRAATLFPETVPGKMWIGAGLELAVAGIVIHSLRAAPLADSGLDPVERLERAIGRTFSGAAARLMATELSVFYYAFAWKAKPHSPAGSRTFTLHEKSGAAVLIGCLAGISLLEIVPVHLLLHRWSAVGAWGVTALSIWGAVWMAALARSFRLRPSWIDEEGVHVRFGLLFRLFIPLDQIAAILPGSDAPAGARVVPRGAVPALYLRFTHALQAELLLGVKRSLPGIALAPDQAEALSDLQAL